MAKIKVESLIKSMTESIEIRLIGEKIPADIAREVAIKATDGIVNEYGGTSIYIPKDMRLFSDARNKKILAEFDGKNVSFLAQKYQLSEVWIYSILRNNNIQIAQD